jgi:class 3 adenylate cyclase
MTKNCILVVEDDPAILQGLEELLHLENYDVLLTSDGMNAVEQAIQKQPDLILLDINLPSLSGYEVCKRLRDREFVNPVIMLTSRDDQTDRIVGLELGANDYITKPFNPRELLARIRTNLSNAERIREKEDEIISHDVKRRKLLAIMFTDMKDYSKLMNIDEKLALDILDVHNNILKEIILMHGGKIVEIIGDAFLVTFESAVKSVECAYEIQNRLCESNLDKSAEEQIIIRIGIHLGDIIEYNDNIKGDAVNIAARIEQTALPGSIYISENVYNAVKNKVKFNIKYTGEFSFKNINEEFKLYSITI